MLDISGNPNLDRHGTTTLWARAGVYAHWTRSTSGSLLFWWVEALFGLWARVAVPVLPATASASASAGYHISAPIPPVLTLQRKTPCPIHLRRILESSLAFPHGLSGTPLRMVQLPLGLGVSRLQHLIGRAYAVLSTLDVLRHIENGWSRKYKHLVEVRANSCQLAMGLSPGYTPTLTFDLMLQLSENLPCSRFQDVGL